MRAGIYVRISDDREGAGLGVERQEKDCRALAKRLGWHVAEVFVDNDLTAYTSSKRSKPRPGYEALKTALTARDITAVLVWHTDRLHRSPRELEDFIDVCRGDVPVETVQAGVIDLRTPAGQAVARTLCAWAFYESAHKSQRVRAKYVQLAEAGLPGNGGYRPFGYTKDRRALVEDEAEQLRWAYTQVLAGRSLRSIAGDLTAAGFLSTQGKPWTVQALRYNLRSPRNAGLREHRGVIVGPAVWPPVVDVATWEQVCAILNSPDRLNAGGTNARRHLLTGFLWCGRCGGRLVPRSAGSTRQRYGCLPAKEGGCGGSTVHIDTVEDYVTDLVLARLERDASLEPKQHDPTGDLLHRIAIDEQRLEDLAAAFADDPDGNPLELRSAGALLRKRIAATRREIDKVTVRQGIAQPLIVRKAWPDYDLSQRRLVLAQLLDRIDVGPGVPGRFAPQRLQVTWR